MLGTIYACEHTTDYSVQVEKAEYYEIDVEGMEGDEDPMSFTEPRMSGSDGFCRCG